MKNLNNGSLSALLLKKECSLAASVLSYLFIAFALMTFIPGYPIAIAGFFVCFGIFHSYQTSRENNDTLYTVLLPVRKSDAVKAKYLFAVMIQMIAFALCLVFTIIRMTAMKNAAAYVNNPMMNANQFYLACILLIYSVFNSAFICGFFKTAYKFGKPFVLFGILGFLIITAAEVLHHIPTLEWLNAAGSMADIRMWIILAAAAAIYAVSTVLSCKKAQKLFEKIDL